jgi:hypothetical protein
VGEGRPRSIQLPDLSGLDNALTANHMLEMTFRGTGFPRGEASGLVTALVRTTESAVEAYGRARGSLIDAINRNSFGTYLKGLSEMEISVTALDRAMRVAERLIRSEETTVGEGDLPSKGARTRLSRMRNAIDHVDKPIAAGRFGGGEYLFLYVNDCDLLIHDGGGELRVKQTDLGDWVHQLHGLAASLTGDPLAWRRGNG